jgi:hypothetical protein
VIYRQDTPNAVPNGIERGIQGRVQRNIEVLETRPSGVALYDGPDGLIGYYDPTVPDTSVSAAPRRGWPGETYFPYFGGEATVFADPTGAPVAILCSNRLSTSNARCIMRFPYKEKSKIIVTFQYYSPDDAHLIDAGIIKDWRAIRAFAENVYDDSFVCNIGTSDTLENCGDYDAFNAP